MPRSLLACLLILVVPAVATAADAASAERKTGLPHVLVLLSYHRGQPWEDGIAAGMLEAFGDRAEPVFVHFDHKRFPTGLAADHRMAIAVEASRRIQPAVVVAVDDYAYEQAVAHRDVLAPGVPLVFCGLNHWQDDWRQPRSTGVAEVFDPAGTLALAFTLHPRAQRLVVLNDATDTGVANRATFDAAMPSAAAGRTVEHLGLGTFAATEAALGGLDPQRDVVLMLTWNIDATGATQGHEASVRRARAASRAPIYGVWDFQFGHGIVGGSLFDGRVHGREAGELVRAILDGADPDHLPVRTAPRTRLVVDARELARFNASRRLVPTTVEVVFAPPSFWDEHGRVLLIAAVVIAAQMATIAGLLISRARRRRAEDARRQAEARLRQGSRMDAVGQLASGVAHDFNNVLTAILGHADLLAMRLEPDSPLRGHVETISGAAQRAAGTVRNLLAFARGRSGTTRSSDVPRLVQDVVALLQHAIDRRISVTCRLAPDTGLARIGAEELQQVLVNLALNARDAMAEGGRLTVTSAREELIAEAAALGLAPGPYVRIEVADTGCGIAPEHLERIFDPFFTTKEVGKGTGLGLSVLHGIVAAAHGALRVDSRPGEGACFRLWLPAAAKVPSDARPAVRPPSRLRVLLVDDEPVVLDVVGELLRACGAAVEAFADPLRAGAWFADHAAEVDLALLDGNMPGLTGWQLATRLRQARPDLRVVALTGAATPEAQTAWETAGVVRLLCKPVTRDQLAEVLAEAEAG